MVGDYQDGAVRKKPVSIYYVLTDGTVEHRVTCKRTTPDRLGQNNPPGTKYVIRQGPRTKLWEVYRRSRFILNPSTGQFYKAPAPCVTSPHRIAAIGYAQIMPA